MMEKLSPYPVMREGTISLCHFMGLITLLNRWTGVVISIHQFTSQLFRK
jgi:hypothetical protein